jgi:hypothetical protein
MHLAGRAIVLLTALLLLGCSGDDVGNREAAEPGATPASPSLPEAGTPLQFTTWRNAPRIAILYSRQDDSRIASAQEAVAFWNGELSALESGFRLGEVKLVNQTIPADLLTRLSNSVGTRPSAGDFAAVSKGLDDADLIVILSDANFVSFSSGILAVGGRSRSFVAIRSIVPALAQPNIMPNIIAHELGHSLGLGHNADVTKLMCGRPAECRPDSFASDERRWFPLTDSEKTRLRSLYPPGWKPSAGP